MPTPESKFEFSWRSVLGDPPMINVPVETKIDDENGARNKQVLRRGGMSGRLWFCGDGTYVYYTPTHWRPLG